MSYRVFKRLLGETDLERKCRFLLGGGILLLMTLSFWGYARQTEGLAYDQMVTSGRLLVPPILAREHLESDRRDAINAFQQQSEKTYPDALSEYRYKVLKPDARQPEQKPEGDEVSVVNKLAANPDLGEDMANQSAQGVFYYYGAIRAQASCLDCHNKRAATGGVANKLLQEVRTLCASADVKVRSFSRPATYLEIARSCTSRHRPSVPPVLAFFTRTNRSRQSLGKVAVFSPTPCA